MPDTSKSGADSRDVRLGVKEIIISIFFGLTIGFGTGFVGTGGGMMMLVILTVLGAAMIYLNYFHKG